jgi:HTH-type transcriptional regulator/antitoxin HigA
MSSDDLGGSPGDLVASLMTERGWSQSDLAYVLGVTAATVSQIVKSKRPITPEMAKLLSVAFDRPAEMFVEMQARWNLLSAPDPSAEVETRALAQSNYPLREMIKRGWIGETKDGFDLHRELCRFFAVNSLDSVPKFTHAAKKTLRDNVPGSQLAWLYRVRQIAKEMPTPAYSRSKMEHALEQMSRFREAPEEIRHIPRILHECGVRFVIVEGLPGGRIDGVCFWLDATNPVIGLSMRFDRIDNFWFVLIHECAHVLHGHGKGSEIIDTDLGSEVGDESDEERIANADAREFCIPTAKMLSFHARKAPFFSDLDVRAFAKLQGVHPGIVVGQLHHITGEYRNLRQHLVGVRKYITNAALVDGWGDIAPVN